MQLLRDYTRERLDYLAEKFLDRPLKPVEYNLFLHEKDDDLEKMYVKLRQEVDKPIIEYLKRLKEEDKE